MRLDAEARPASSPAPALPALAPVDVEGLDVFVVEASIVGAVDDRRAHGRTALSRGDRIVALATGGDGRLVPGGFTPILVEAGGPEEVTPVLDHLGAGGTCPNESP